MIIVNCWECEECVFENGWLVNLIVEKLLECSGWINREEFLKFFGNMVLVEIGVE